MLAASTFRRIAGERLDAGDCGCDEWLPGSLRINLDPSHLRFGEAVAEILAF